MRFARPSVRSLSLSLVLVTLAFSLASVSEVDAKGRPNRALLLTPENVVPGPGEAGASGSFTWSGGRNEFCFEVSVQNLGSFIQQIVIRRGVAGTTGSQVLRLSPSPIGIHGLRGCVPADRALIREIQGAPEQFYLEIQTVGYPSGALRGQLRQ
jgi:hypothetical protein